MDWSGKFSENPRCQILYFEVKMYPKHLAAGLRPDPLDEQSASSKPLTAISGQGIEHSLAEIRGAVWLGLVGKGRLRSLGRYGKGEQGERVGKCIQTQHCQRLKGIVY